MKIINLPTFAEYCATESGCGVRFTNNFNRTGGIYRQKIENAYYMHCETLDAYSSGYLRFGMYTNIEDTTIDINRRFKIDMKKTHRSKKKINIYL